jgi:23S rRNA (cytidine1920-2'-O)/16S rRNA (cytidine1409-2'-O)-methyltransferase
MVARGLVPSRSQAQQLIRSGLVTVDAVVVTKPSRPVRASEVVTLVRADGVPAGPDGGAPQDPGGAQDPGAASWILRGWVGRGALKLEHALATWGPAGLTVEGARCLDVGASTGGFTQVLLEHGAEHVVALDVGRGQLHARLRDDPRVTDVPQTSIRDVRPGDLGEPFQVLVADLSFISLSLVLPAVAGLLAEGGHAVLLVKPQFEVGRRAVGRGGVVRSARARAQVLERLDGEARASGLTPVDLDRSPVTGTTGNVEYLWWLRACPSGMMDCGRAPDRLAARRRELRGQEEP